MFLLGFHDKMLENCRSSDPVLPFFFLRENLSNVCAGVLMISNISL